MTSLRSILPLFAVLLTICSASLHAATANFQVSSGNFNVPGNWSTGLVPGPADTASIANGNVCTVTDTRSIASLTLSGGTITVNTPGALTTGGITLNANTFSNFINGSGNITLTGTFTAQPLGSLAGTGQLILGSTATMTIPGSIQIQQRSIVIQSGGKLNFTALSTASINMSNGASINIQDGGTFDVKSDQPINATNGATIVNAGTFSKTGGFSTILIQPAVSNSKTLLIQSGGMNFAGGYTDNGGTVFVDGGTFQGTLNLTSGLLTGFGDVMGDVNQTGGIVLPGSIASPGVIDISGNYSQGAGGFLLIPIRGTAPSEDFSRVDVVGTATLGGGLDIFLNGFTPAPTDTFDIVVAASVGGKFTAVDNGGSTLGPVYLAGTVQLQKLANIISVTTIEALPSPARAGGDVVITATPSNPGGASLTYSWDFGDATSGSGNPVTHVYSPTVDTTYTVVVTVFDGQQTVTGTMAVTVLAPNVGGSGGNISQGDSATNPLSGLKISVTSSNAGLLELSIDENQGALSRAASDIETSFSSDGDGLPTRFGSKVVQKFDKSSIYAASTIVKDSATGATKSKARKTVPVSSREVGQMNSAIVEPQNRALLTSSLKGKFIFIKDKPDQVTYSGSFEMPAGVDLREPQTLVFAMGNVIDSIALTTKGKGVTPSTKGAIKKLQVKFPRVDRKNPVTTSGQMAKLTATYFTADLDLKGFDTEGITSTKRDDEVGSKTVSRTIQLAMNLSGVTYEAAVPVEFKLSPKADAGAIQGRRANQ